MERVVVGKNVTPWTEGQSELRGPSKRLDLEGVRTKLQGAAPDIELPRPLRLRKMDRLSRIAELVAEDDRPDRPLVGQVDPVVQPVHRRGHGVLGIRERESSEQPPPLVSPAVAVVVRQEQDIWSVSHDHAMLPRHHSRRHGQPVGEQGRGIRTAVAVSVLQQPHASESALRVQRIARVLHDPCAAVRSEGHRDWIRDPRLGKVQLDREVRMDLKQLKGCFGGIRRPGRRPAPCQR